MRLHETRDGALWIAGLGQEAVMLDYNTGRWQTYQNLMFQCQAPDGSMWFVERDHWRVVVRRGDVWTRYDERDGLVEDARAILVSADGNIWVMGSHHAVAALSRFENGQWTLQTFPQFASSVFTSAVYAAADTSVWLGARLPYGGRGQSGGIMVIKKENDLWQSFVYTPSTGASPAPYAITQGRDGTYWSGQIGLQKLVGNRWISVGEPDVLNTTWIQRLYSSPTSDLWVGTRTEGLFWHCHLANTH
jgi:hypothetical protein